MIDLIKESSQCSSEEQILLPMCDILPANQIITKNYESDQAPIMKLIPKQLQKQKQSSALSQTLNQHKVSKQEFLDYAKLFGSQDFLGKQYANQLDQIVYFKFNNKDYNQLKVGEKKFRFFSGFFAGKQHFENLISQKYDNIMKSFPQFEFAEYNNNLLESFGENSKGCPQDPIFSSNYDSANLFAVIKKREFEYDLILQNDMNSKGNNQWFNFLVNFTEQGTYKFNIVNFTKSHSLYEQGMRIACYSYSKQCYKGNHENQKSGAGWFRGGKNIKYYRNGIQRETLGSNASYYTLSFDYTCKHQAESIMFAYTYPYTNLQMEKFFNKMLHRRVIGHLKMEKMYLCNSVSGHPIYSYMISHKKLRSNSPKFNSSIFNAVDSKPQQSSKGFNFSTKFSRRNSSPQLGQENTTQKSVILMARQHSGQVQSSYVMQGIVDFLMANTQLDQIKKNYVFYVFPMINVDGVKYGHYRTNLYGFDLNRIWRAPQKQTHPEVYHLKKLMHQINKNTPISLILDIHGHSTSLNSFFYGNQSKKENMQFDDSKLFPFICSKRINEISFKQSTFSIREDKKNSARVVLSQMFPKSLVYTLENSFYGYISKKDKVQTGVDAKQDVIEYNPEGYRKLGRQIMRTFLDYTKISEKHNFIKAKWIKQIEEIQLETQKLKLNNSTNDDGGSDSELQNQLIDFEEKPIEETKTEREEKNIFPRKLEKAKSSILNKKNCIFRKIEKKRTLPLPRTICQENVRGFGSYNFKSFNTLRDLSQKKTHPFENKQNLVGKNHMDIAKKPECSQALLSIFKIQTQQSALLKKKTSINSLMGYQQTRSHEKASLSPSPNLLYNSSKNKFQRQTSNKLIIQPRKMESIAQSEEKQCVQDVIMKCTGMKTFFKATGLTIQNRRS